MPSLNRVTLMGNLTRDPELRYTPKGTACTDIALAINRRWKTDSGQVQEEVTFVDITYWGRQAEIVCQYLKKGSPLYVEGRLHMDTWDDNQTGQKRQRMKVIGEALEFIGGPAGSSSGNANGSSDGSIPARNASPARPPTQTQKAAEFARSPIGPPSDDDIIF